MALITVPHAGDSYHLERVMYWLQHRNVNYYDTHVMRQLYSPVFTEYIQLNVFLITGGELFAKVVQNASAYGCLILLYGTIRNLGCSVRWALFGCILALSMNVFTAESISSTSVDLVGSFYLMTLVYMIIETLYASKLTIFRFILLGLACGLIYITKTNACAPAAVIIIYVVIARLLKSDFKIIPLGLVSLVCIGLIVFPTFYRNYQAFDGDFMARLNVDDIAIGTFAPRYVFVNVIKNLCTIGVERNAVALVEAVKALGNALKVNIDAPEIAWAGFGFGPATFKYSFDLTYAGAHLVTPLFLIATLVSAIYLVKRRTRTEGLMFAMTLQMFSILIILRWQPCGGRLILPALIVAIIPIVYYFREITNSFGATSRKHKACCFLVLYFVFEAGICSTESLAFHSYLEVNNFRWPRFARHWGIIARTGKTFTAYQNFEQLLDEGDFDNIGLDGVEYMDQYPILAKYVPQGKRVESVRLLGNNRNISVINPNFLIAPKDPESLMKPLNPNFAPDIILVESVGLDPEKNYVCNENIYECVYALDNYSAWLRIKK